MRQLFINYRRDDTAIHASSLKGMLAAKFGPAFAFKDTRDIPPGADFVSIIEGEIEHCALMIVLIGERWLELSQRREDTRERDYAVHEIAVMLRRDRPVVPVLIGGAEMPDESELPESIRALAVRHAVRLRDQHFDEDVDDLCESLRQYYPSLFPSEKPLVPVRRVRARTARPRPRLARCVVIAVLAAFALLWTSADFREWVVRSVGNFAPESGPTENTSAAPEAGHGAVDTAPGQPEGGGEETPQDAGEDPPMPARPPGAYLLQDVSAGSPIERHQIEFVPATAAPCLRPIHFARHLRGGVFVRDLKRGHCLEWGDIGIQ